MEISSGAARIPWLILGVGLDAALGMGWLSSLRYQTDSENLLSNGGATAGVTGMQTSAGNFDVLLDYQHYSILDNAFGLQSHSGQAPGLLTRYALLFGHSGIAAQGGYSILPGGKDFTAGADLSHYWILGDAIVLHGKAGYLSQIEKDNPIAAVAALRAQNAGITMNLSADPWVFELSAGAKFYPSISQAQADKLAQDTNNVRGLPWNAIRSGYLYGYRPVWTWLSLGGFASCADSHHDFYTFLYHSAQPKTDTYMYFPYNTPLDDYAFGGVVALDLRPQGPDPFGAFTAKVTFPFYSRREQFYQIRSANGIPMYEGYYPFHGDEAWTASLQWKKTIGNTALILDYQFSLKPYLEYGFFSSESYRTQAVEIKFTSS